MWIVYTKASEGNPCTEDISNICGMAFPESYQSVYDARMCLRSSLETSLSCRDYLENVSPSIIEPCYNEITRNCKNVNPGNNRMHECLSKYSESLTKECSAALSRNEKTAEMESVKPLNGNLRRQSDSVNAQKASSYLTSVLEEILPKIKALHDMLSSSLNRLLKDNSSTIIQKLNTSTAAEQAAAEEEQPEEDPHYSPEYFRVDDDKESHYEIVDDDQQQ